MRAGNASGTLTNAGTDEMAIRNDWVNNQYFTFEATYTTAS